MKLKKLLLFILIFFFCLVIKNNVNAYVVNEGGQGKYYLQDLEFDDSGELYTSIFFYNSNSNIVVCFQIQNYNTLAYDRVDNKFYLFDNSDGTTKGISYYKCSVSVQDGLLIGGNWLQSYGNTVSLSGYKYIGGTGKLYPCYLDKYPITILPEGVSWADDFLMYYHSNYGSVALYYPTQFEDGIFAETSGQACYYGDVNSTNKILYNIYKYDLSSKTWSFQGTSTVTSYGGINNGYGGTIHKYFYNTKDILKGDDRSVVALSSTKDYFKGLYEYRNFPYILNGQEDLAKGEEDIIIMPRRL